MMKNLTDLFTDENLMLAIVGATVATAVTQSVKATPKAIQNAPFLTMVGGAVLLPVANNFLAPGKKAAST